MMKSLSIYKSDSINIWQRLRYRFVHLAEKIFYRCLLIAQRRERNGQALQWFNNDINAKRVVRQFDLYEDDYDRKLFYSYRSSIQLGPEKHEVAFRAYFMRDAILDTCNSDKRIRTVINVGSGYGWLESETAALLPDVKVVGIDRRQADRNTREYHIVGKRVARHETEFPRQHYVAYFMGKRN